MGDGHHVASLEDSVVGKVGDVAGHPAALQGLDQVLIIDQAAPGQVDEPHAALHHLEGAGVDHALGVPVEGQVEGDVVAVFIDGLQVVCPLNHAGEGEGRVHGQEGVVAPHGHAQLGGDIGHLDADGSQTHHAQGLALDFWAHKLALALLHRFFYVGPRGGLFLHPGRAAHHVPGGEQHGADDQLLDGVGVGAGGVEHGDARLGAAVDGDIVGARARPGDGPQILREYVLVHVRRADQDAVLILHVGADGKAALVQHGQAGRGNFIQRFDAVHVWFAPSQLFLSKALINSHNFSTPSTGMAL